MHTCYKYIIEKKQLRKFTNASILTIMSVFTESNSRILDYLSVNTQFLCAYL